MTQTHRLGLPLLAAGQAQKEITYNEALAIIDVVAQSSVESADLATPPGSPAFGQCWVVASGAAEAWITRETTLTVWTPSGWLFVQPHEGWRLWAIDRGNMIRFDGTDWIDEDVRADGYHVGDDKVVGARQAAIATPSGGATQDSEARSAIAAILAALRVHGLIAT